MGTPYCRDRAFPASTHDLSLLFYKGLYTVSANAEAIFQIDLHL